MISWQDIHVAKSDPAQNWVLVTVGAARGSTPRDCGTKMLVSETQLRGTIGGGQLEYVVIDKARQILADKSLPHHQLMQLPLGPELAQCCGGYTEIMLERLQDTDLTCFEGLENAGTHENAYAVMCHWTAQAVRRELLLFSEAPRADAPQICAALEEAQNFGTSSIIEAEKYSGNFTLVEPLTVNRFQLVIFGAGHVGRAVVHTLSPLPCQIIWVDQRQDEFPETIPANVLKTLTSAPVEMARKVAKNSYFLIMTHSHKLDQELVAEILKRGDSSYLGLIGSKTKKARFINRLKSSGFSDADLGALTCPIGIAGAEGKHPTEIAISVAAEILQVHAQRQQEFAENTGATGNIFAQKGH
jgi:xanthine dehydrogenase accessory factor